ncbi:UNVERIFIED_CONTAM: hypothetical protein H355_004180 [Colinus virginianus]|nr:hypothetical protein H355_004180 [Colinus virginianus]
MCEIMVLTLIGLGLCDEKDITARGLEEVQKADIVYLEAYTAILGASRAQLVYRFGQIVSIPFFHGNWRPDSFYEKIKKNIDAECHTLCLLDIKVKEQTTENMMKGNRIFEPSRYDGQLRCSIRGL